MAILLRVLWALYGFLWLGGLITGGVSKLTPWAAPLFLILAGTVAILENRKAWRALLLSAACGYMFELMGVHTGYPFGRYQYTEVLAPSIAGVPVAMTLAWLILIDFVRGVTKDILWGSLLMAAIDLVIDPLAAGPLRYWEWFEHGRYYGIPAINYVGWVLTSILILAILPKHPPRRAYVGWSVVAFFTVLAVEKGLYLPAGIGLVIVLVPLYRVFWPKAV